MGTLLANAGVLGSSEGDEHSALMTQGSQREGLMLDSHEELYRRFTQQVAKNLHVVFAMNPPEDGLAPRAATSPALFNHCVLDWFGDLPDQAFYQAGPELTPTLGLDLPSYNPPQFFPDCVPLASDASYSSNGGCERASARASDVIPDQQKAE